MAEEKITAEQKLKQYEDMLNELLNGKVKREGKIIAVSEKLYKVQMGADEILAYSPFHKLLKNTSVVVAEGVIVDLVPEPLITVEEEEVEFSRIGWEEIGGMKSQIESIRKKVERPLKFASIYKQYKMPLSKGILLWGPTGCGKTLIAKAIASSMIESKTISKNIFIYLKGGEMLSKYVGVAENRIKSAFDSARKTFKKTGVRPIIFIDEAEALLPPRGSRISSDVDTTIVPTFLSEMDGLEEGNPFVLLATNYEDRIDDAIMRPGRIDLKVYVGRPTVEDSVEIFKIHLKKTRLAGDIDKLSHDASKILFATEKLQGEISGALIENLVFSAVEIAISRTIAGDKKFGVCKADIEKAIQQR